MKKILSIIFLGAALFATTSCVSEEDLLFDKSAAERLNEASDLYSQRILDSKHGWALEYFPHSSTDEDLPLKGAGFLMLAKFEADKSVVVGMNNFMSRNAYKEDRSVWEVITDNGPVLSFNSHNDCIHAFSVPEDIAGTSEDETGKGMEGDYEFVMVDVPEGGDYILLKGKKRGAYSRMTRLDEETDFQEYLTDVKNFTNKVFDTKAPNNVVVNIGEESYNMIMAQDGGQYGIVKMWPSESDSTFTKVLRPILVTRHGTKDNYTYNVRFRNAIKVAEDVTEQEFVYSEDAKKFVGVTDEANSIVGENPTNFFAHALRDLHTWNVHKTAVSDQYSAALAQVIDQAATLKYTFKSSAFTSWKDDVVNMNMVFTTTRKVNGKNQTVTATAGFVFEAKETADGVVLTFKGAADESAQNVLDAITSLNGFLTTLGGTYVCRDSGNPFVLDRMTVLKKDNSEFWFDVTYQR